MNSQFEEKQLIITSLKLRAFQMLRECVQKAYSVQTFDMILVGMSNTQNAAVAEKHLNLVNSMMMMMLTMMIVVVVMMMMDDDDDDDDDDDHGDAYDDSDRLNLPDTPTSIRLLFKLQVSTHRNGETQPSNSRFGHIAWGRLPE